MKTIFIDIDDTVRQTSKAIIKYAKKEFKDTIKSKKYPVTFKRGYDYIQYYENYGHIFLLMAKKVFFSRMFCKILNLCGFEIIFLSCQPQQRMREVTVDWLAKNKFINRKDLFFGKSVNNYMFVDKMNNKIEYLDKYKNNKLILLDDYPFFDTYIHKVCKHILIKNIWHKHNNIKGSVRLSPILLFKILISI